MASSVEGLDELNAFLRRVPKRAEVREAVRDVALDVSLEARYLAPRPIRHQVNVRNDNDGEITTAVETRSQLGAIMEFGSPTLPGGRPFLGPALELHADDLPKAVEDLIDKWLRS